jgi:hypothetical protein
MIADTSMAYSSGRPSRAGCGTCDSKIDFVSPGRPAIIGVSITPGGFVRKISGRAQCQPHHTTLACGVRRLADLAIKGCHARSHDDQPAVAVERLTIDHGRSRQPQHIEGADQIDVDHRAKVLQRQHAALADHPTGSTHPRAVDHDPQGAEFCRCLNRCLHLIFIAYVGRGKSDPGSELKRQLSPGRVR